MKKNIFLIIVITAQLFASDLLLLHKQKQEIQVQKLKEIKASHKSQRYNWILPLNLSLSKSKSKSAIDNTYNTVDNISVNLNQDIFRSGGIYYTLSYADRQKNYALLSWEKENADLYQQVYSTTLNLKQLRLQLKQSSYRLKNFDIEIFLKKEQYKIGTVDMTLLNSAIMDKNEELRRMITIKESIASTEKILKKLTPLSYEKIDVPTFTMVSKKDYMDVNYVINQAAIQSDLSNDQYKITKSSYLPYLSINAELGYQDYEYKTYATNYDGDYHSVGLTLKMPLDFNTNSILEEQRAAYLQAKLTIEDEKIAQDAEYEESQSLIKNYQEYIEVTRKNLALYDELITMTKQGFKAGYKSGYDLQTIENTRIIDALEIEINETNIQLELLKLHFAQQQRIDHG